MQLKMKQGGQRGNKEEDSDGSPQMKNSLSEQPKAQKHEYVVKAPVTPAVSLLCVKGSGGTKSLFCKSHVTFKSLYSSSNS